MSSTARFIADVSRVSRYARLGEVVGAWDRFRRRLLTPDVSEASLEKRGFYRKNQAAQDLLETVGKVFLDGFGDAVESRSTADAEQRLERVPTRFRGFAYEGAAMGLAVRDGLPLGGRGHVASLLAGGGDRHHYMVYVGVGWAMARLPRFRWPDPDDFDPLLVWLILDGYGFHQAYFHTRRYVTQRYRAESFPWPGGAHAGYANRAIDQGIGRALWFVAGTDPARATTLANRFPADRRPDLYSGIGLAATYAGGVDAADLHDLAERAGTYRPELAQGSAFAAEARIRAGLVVPHTALATGVLCGTDPEHAARITRQVRPGPAEISGVAPGSGAARRPGSAHRPGASSGAPVVPAYEVWRRRIAHEFVSLGGIPK